MPAVVRLVATWVLLTTLSAGQEPRGPKPREDFAQLAEGVTSPTKRDTIEAGYRMFSAPDFGATCAQAHAQDVKRLEAVSSRPRLRVGHEFDPSQLKILALNASGAVLPKVPIAIEIERWAPPVMEGEGIHIADGLVRPHHAGTFRFRIRTICDAPGSETFITASVRR